MTRLELYYDVMGNLPSSYDGDFKDHIESVLNQYVDCLQDLDSEQIPNDWETTLDNVTAIKNKILEIIEDTYKGLHGKAHSKFNRYIFNPLIKEDKLKKHKFPVNTSWYRMRIFESQKHNLSRNHMFHIPLDKRGIVKTQRYSAPGYPCLYLGASIYTCWEEMHRPNLNSCFVSRLKNTKAMELLDLTIPSEPWSIFNGEFDIPDNTKFEPDIQLKNFDFTIDNEFSNRAEKKYYKSDSSITKKSYENEFKNPSRIEIENDFDVFHNHSNPTFIKQQMSTKSDDSDFISDIIRIPLILASMVKVKNTDDIFKPEYIIPQHIMESIIEMIQKKDNKLIGVYYTSVNMHEDFKFSFSHNDANEVIHQNNIALPIQNPDSKSSYCDKLCSIFEISNPACEEFELAKNTSDFLRTYNRSEDEVSKMRQYDYEDSVFYQLERRLCKDGLFPLEHLTPDG